MITDNNKDDNARPDKDEPIKETEKETETGAEKTEEAEEAEEASGAENSPVEESKVTEEIPEPQKPAKQSFYKKRSFKFGSMATAFTAIFVAIVVLVNVGLTLLAQKYPISADLTTTKDYELSTDTLSYLKKLDKPVVIKIFATEQQMESESDLVTPNKIIQQYPKYNSKIKVEYIDPDKNPTAVAAYSNESIQQYDVIVSSTNAEGKEIYKYISGSDLLVTQTDSSTYQTTVIGNQTEQQIDSAIDYVTSTVHPTILVTTGHNEADSSSFQTLLKNGNYNISTVNTATSAIDESASGIVIMAPSADFSSDEIAKIDAFLKNGGKYGKNIFIFLDPREPALPNLEEYISEWGVKVGNGVIYDSANNFDNSIYEPSSSSVDQTSVGQDVPSTISTDVKISLPLTDIFTSKDSRAVTNVIQTGDSSKLMTDLQSGEPTASDKSGPFTAMTISTWTESDGTALNKSSMVVSGSYEITDQDLLNSPSKNNAKVLLGIANTLMGKQSTINVDSKINQSTSLNLTTNQRDVIMIIFIVLVPLAVLIIGLIMWLRRRHL